MLMNRNLLDVVGNFAVLDGDTLFYENDIAKQIRYRYLTEYILYTEVSDLFNQNYSYLTFLKIKYYNAYIVKLPTDNYKKCHVNYFQLKQCLRQLNKIAKYDSIIALPIVYTWKNYYTIYNIVKEKLINHYVIFYIYN